MATPKPRQPRRPASQEGLLLWVINRFGEEFDEHAILKGGMALRLLSSSRHTNDVDYTFVPYTSKKEISVSLEKILRTLQDARVGVTQHSTMIRYDVTLDEVSIQVKVTVSKACASIPMATASMALPQGIPSQIVRIMEPSVALAHKLAAWNERRLERDLYDVYFLTERARAMPDMSTLRARCHSFRSRLPHLRHYKRLSFAQLAEALDEVSAGLTDSLLQERFLGLVDASELAGLALRIQVSLRRVVEYLRSAGTE